MVYYNQLIEVVLHLEASMNVWIENTEYEYILRND